MRWHQEADAATPTQTVASKTSRALQLPLLTFHLVLQIDPTLAVSVVLLHAYRSNLVLLVLLVLLLEVPQGLKHLRFAGLVKR